MTTPSIDVFEMEDRTFPPSPSFVAAALTSDRLMFDEADADYEAFWARQAQAPAWSTSSVFLRGHRLRVHVTSSSFP